MISFPAPELCQGADEDLLLAMGDIIFPGFVKRRKGENGLRLWVDGTATDGAARSTATGQFQTLLGVLRVWRPVAGQLREELRAGLGSGAARDPHGNQWITLGTVITYEIVGGDDRIFAGNAGRAIGASQNLRNALWLNGRTNRTAADFYMIHEYAARDLGGKSGITAALGISATSRSGSRNPRTTSRRSMAVVTSASTRRPPGPWRSNRNSPPTWFDAGSCTSHEPIGTAHRNVRF